MSNVLKRHRNLSELEFWRTGTEIRAELTRYLMNEKKVPKRWRPVFTFPGIKYAIKMLEEITAANTIYPTTEAELNQRRAHQNEAIIACEQIIQHMQWMIETLHTSVNDFESLFEKVIKEINLIKGWRQKNKVHTPKGG